MAKAGIAIDTFEYFGTASLALLDLVGTLLLLVVCLALQIMKPKEKHRHCCCLLSFISLFFKSFPLVLLLLFVACYLIKFTLSIYLLLCRLVSFVHLFELSFVSLVRVH